MIIKIKERHFGHATFATSLNITGTGSITSNWGVRIKSITPDKTATCTSSSNPATCTTTGSISANKDSDLAASFAASLIKPGDSVTYTIVIENYGDLDAKLDRINMPASSNTAISFSKGGITEGNKLSAGGEENLTVTVTYVESTNQGQPTNTTSDFRITLDFVQDDGTGTLPATSAEGYIFDTTGHSIGDTIAPSTLSSGMPTGVALKYALDNDNKIESIYSCAKFSFIDEPICLQGDNGGAYFISNNTTLTWLSQNNNFIDNGGVCFLNSNYPSCHASDLNISTNSNGIGGASDNSIADSFCGFGTDLIALCIRYNSSSPIIDDPIIDDTNDS